MPVDRKVRNMMKNLWVAVLACLVPFAANAENVNRTVEADADVHVSISNVAGEIEVEGWNKKSVQVTGSLGSKVKELIVESDGDDVLIKVKLPHRSRGDGDADLKIMMPEGGSLDVGTVSADITVEGVKGEQSLHTVSGDARTEYFGGELEAESVSGDVVVKGDSSEGEVRAATVSGDVVATGISGEVHAESVSGDVSIEDGTITRAGLETVNGNIHFEAAFVGDGKLVADTVNGSVRITFQNDISAQFSIETFNGSIRNCFGPDAERTSKYTPGWELEFTEGRGDARVIVSTLNGGVRICK